VHDRQCAHRPPNLYRELQRSNVIILWKRHFRELGSGHPEVSELVNNDITAILTCWDSHGMAIEESSISEQPTKMISTGEVRGGSGEPVLSESMKPTWKVLKDEFGEHDSNRALIALAALPLVRAYGAQGLEVSRGDVLQHRLLQAQLREQALQVPVFRLQVPSAWSLVHLQPATLQLYYVPVPLGFSGYCPALINHDVIVVSDFTVVARRAKR
jgi:hypothetical protein